MATALIIFVSNRILLESGIFIAGIVPFSPNTYKAGFHHKDDIGIFLQDGFDLCNMLENEILRRLSRTLILVICIGKTKHTFTATITQRLHALADCVQIRLFDELVTIILHIEINMDECISGIIKCLHCSFRQRRNTTTMAFKCFMKPTFGIVEQLIRNR